MSQPSLFYFESDGLCYEGQGEISHVEELIYAFKAIKLAKRCNFRLVIRRFPRWRRLASPRLTFEGSSPSRRSGCYEHVDPRDFDAAESRACAWRPNYPGCRRLRSPSRGPSSLSYNNAKRPLYGLVHSTKSFTEKRYLFLLMLHICYTRYVSSWDTSCLFDYRSQSA